MRSSTRASAAGAVALALALSTPLFAQSPGQAKKRAPNQAVETGHQDDAVLEVAGQFDKRTDAVTMTRLPNGAVGAVLDESFMEAMTVTRRADGSLAFGHTTGLSKAAGGVNAGANGKPPAKPATRATNTKTQRARDAKTPASAKKTSQPSVTLQPPVLEER